MTFPACRGNTSNTGSGQQQVPARQVEGFTAAEAGGDMRVPPTGGAANKIESAPRTTYTTWQFTLCEWGYERYDF